MIATDCIAPNNVGGRFYFKLSNVTESAPYNNAPVLCPECGETVWRWNMIIHYHQKHENTAPPPNFIVSEFEKKCVELVSHKGYIKKKQFNNILMRKYPSLTKA